jgi:hypothetical protein
MGVAGWVLLVGLAVGFFLIGQWLIVKQINIIIGFLYILTGVILCFWLFEKEKTARLVSMGKAVLLGGVVVFYSWASYKSSRGWDASWMTYALALAGGLMAFTVHNPWVRSSQPDRRPVLEDEHKRWVQLGKWGLAVLFIFVAAIIASKRYLAMYDFTGCINWFFVLRIHGVLGDIASGPFTEWGRLWFPLAYLAVLAASYAYILKHQETLRPWKALLYLFVLGNIGGLAIAYLSTEGLGILDAQVRSIHYNFYSVAKTYTHFGDLWQMLGTFATVEIRRFVSFPHTHPPFGIVLNWVLIQLTGGNETLIALGLGALAWTGIFPMFILGRELYNREMGYYMAGLYSVMPSTLIINHIAMDAFSASLAAWTVAAVAIGCRRKNHAWMFWAGLAWAGVASINYTALLLLPALLVMAVILIRDQGWWQAGVLAWLQASLLKMIWFVTGIGLPWGIVLLTTHGRFDYWAMFHYLMSATKQDAAYHPWFIGVWQSWIGYFIHVGLPVTVLFALRWREILHGDWRHDVFPWIGMVIIMIPFCLATARQETEREFMIFNVFVIGTAALALWQGRNTFRSLQPSPGGAVIAESSGGWRTAFFVALVVSFVNAMVIEMLVVDHW